MGYRNYIYIVEKEKADAIRHKSYDELKKITGEDYVSFYDLEDLMGAHEAYELGKDVDFDVSPYEEPFFTDKEVHESTNCDGECVLLNPKVLPVMATFYKNRVRDSWKKRIEDYKKNPEEGGKAIFKDLEHKFVFAENVDAILENKFCLCDTWLWEYDLLNFVYLAKVVDFDKYYLLWRGG